MVEGTLLSRDAGVASRSSGSRTPWRSLEAGLAALFCIFVLFATFGPWFNVVVAYALGAAAIASGALGLVWAHAASHRQSSHAESAAAGIGALTSLVALSVSAYYVGALGLLRNPLVLVVGVGFLALFLVFHFAASPVEGGSA